MRFQKTTYRYAVRYQKSQNMPTIPATIIKVAAIFSEYFRVGVVTDQLPLYVKIQRLIYIAFTSGQKASMICKICRQDLPVQTGHPRIKSFIYENKPTF